MIALVLPTTSMPGQYQQESGGRLRNCFAESLGETAASKVAIRRAPGLVRFGETSQDTFRGALQVGVNAYSAFDGTVVRHSAAGGGETILTGSLPGTSPVSWARNNKSTPDLVAVAPGDGAFIVSTSAVSSYPDSDVGSPNSVCFLKGYFIFSYGDGTMIASGLNSTAINTLDTATAESKPDTLHRVIPHGETLIAAGSGSMEFWNVNGEATGFPFSPTATRGRGILGANALTGHEDGFGYGIFFAADDFSIRKLVGYDSEKISPPDLDRLIEQVEDKTTIQMSCFISQGHPFVVVQCDDWTWIFDVTLGRWHERVSYQQPRWRGVLPFKAFGKWYCGDTQSGNLHEIDTLEQREDGLPLVADVETGPMGNFPQGTKVSRLDLLVSVGVGRVSGVEPIEITPIIDIFISKDNGLSWSNAWQRKLGPIGRGLTKVTVNNMGICGPQGVKFRFRVSDPVHVAILGGDVAVSVIGK